MSKRVREAPEVAAAARRMLRALVRRAGEGELEALEALVQLQAEAEAQLALGVLAYRQGPADASWTTIAEVVGTTRQSAWERFRP